MTDKEITRYEGYCTKYDRDLGTDYTEIADYEESPDGGFVLYEDYTEAQAKLTEERDEALRLLVQYSNHMWLPEKLLTPTIELVNKYTAEKEDCPACQKENKGYWYGFCPECGWHGSARLAFGGGPIGMTGDYDDVICPECTKREVYTLLEDGDCPNCKGTGKIQKFRRK